jgi:hypothetical protein
VPRPRHALLASLAAAVLLAVPAGPAAAASHPVPAQANPAVVTAAPSFRPIAGLLDGRTGPQLFTDSFVISYVGPAVPAVGDCHHLGRHNRVVWLTPDLLTCHLRAGDTAVALVGASCSDVEAPPFFAIGQDAQLACAREFNAALTSMTLAVDTGVPVELTRRAFAVSPPQRRIDIPADNPAGLPAGPARFTSDGWAAALRPTAPGTHTVHVTATFAGLDTPIVETFTLIVAPDGSH